MFKHKRENGSFLIWISFLIVALSYISTYLYYQNKSSFIKVEMQSAADNATLSATKIFCSSDLCFEDAWDNVFFTLNSNLKTYLAGKTLNFREEYQNFIAGSNSRYSQGVRNLENNKTYYYSSWDFSDTHGIKVEINRGVRWPNGEFESLEGDWQENNSGIPRYSIANSTEVILTAEKSLGIFDNLIPAAGFKNISTSKSYVNQQVDKSSIAPFAIHICSLIAPKLEYEFTNDLKITLIGHEFQDSNYICMGDRLFTKASRMCPIDKPDCNLLPEFPYYPKINGTLVYNPEYTQKDYFGVIGLPRQTLIAHGLNDEELASQDTPNIQLKLENAFIAELNKYITGTYFDIPISGSSQKNDFIIFKNGLTQSSAEEVLLKIILAKEGDKKNRVSYNETDLSDYIFKKYDTKGVYLPMDRDDSMDEYTNPRGYCNSRRVYMPGERQTSMNALELDLDNIHYDNYLNELYAMTNFINLSKNPAYSLVYPPNKEAFKAQAQNSCLLVEHIGSEYARHNTTTQADAWDNQYFFQSWSFRSNIVKKYLTKELRNSAIAFTGKNDALYAPVWQVRVPVISENGSLCQGMTNSKGELEANDPSIDINKEYQTIGYIKINIFDLDIGYPAPAYPHIKSNGTNEACDWETESCSICKTYSHTSMPTPYCGSTFTDKGTYTPVGQILRSCNLTAPLGPEDTIIYQSYSPHIYPFGFTQDMQSKDWISRPPYVPYSHNPDSCNLVRARVSCGAKIEIAEAIDNPTSEEKVVILTK